MLGRDVGGAGERVTVTTLADLDPEQVDMRTLVIVGSSTTRVVRRGDRDVVFTPRHYSDARWASAPGRHAVRTITAPTPVAAIAQP